MKEALKELEHRLRQDSALSVIAWLEDELQKTPDLELAAVYARRLAELCSQETLSSLRHKSVNYGVMAARAYVKTGRLFPAVALMSWLIDQGASAAEVESLRELVVSSFAEPVRKKSKQSDDHNPPPTPFKTLKGSVSSEVDDLTWNRTQWELPSPHRIPLFSSLQPHEFRSLLNMMKPRRLKRGEIVFKEGDVSNSFYVVSEGELLLESSQGFHRSFKEGDFFGEVALFAEQPRSATITANSDAEVLELSKSDFEDCYQRFPEMVWMVRRFYEKRLFMNVALRSPLFSGMRDVDIEEFSKYLVSIELQKGKSFPLEAGSENFIFLIRGRASLMQEGREVQKLERGSLYCNAIFKQPNPPKRHMEAFEDTEWLECGEETFKILTDRFPQFSKNILEIAGLDDPDRTVIRSRLIVD